MSEVTSGNGAWMIAGASAAAVTLLLIVVVRRFVVMRRRALRTLSEGSRLAETERGTVEYTRVGDGPVVLSLHGGLGGWDQGLVIAERWLGLTKAGFSVLAPSRPGYLRTPVAAGQTPDAAADAMAALLDELGIERVLVLGTSGGGPTALQFVLRHPGRAHALVMFTAISGRHVQPGRTQRRYGWFLFSTYGAWLLDFGWWIIIGMVRRFPRLMVKSMFNATTTRDFETQREVDYVMAHPEALAGIQDLMATQFPLSTRKPGLDNDLEVFAELPDYPLHEIDRPTFVVHGRLDGNVAFSHGEVVADTVPGAEMYVVEKGGHLVCSGPAAPEIRAALVRFLRQHARAPTR